MNLDYNIILYLVFDFRIEDVTGRRLMTHYTLKHQKFLRHFQNFSSNMTMIAR